MKIHDEVWQRHVRFEPDPPQRGRLGAIAVVAGCLGGLVLAGLMLSGCVGTYATGTNWRVMRLAVFHADEMSVTFSPTNGATLTGYKGQAQADALGTVIGAAVKAAGALK